jgi:hypothetical protein
MVRALLDGRKTQTRRIIKPQPDSDRELREITASTPEGWADHRSHSGLWSHDGDPGDTAFKRPYGKTGDFLWVRESLWIQRADTSEYCYAATDDVSYEGSVQWRRRPSIHMPRHSSRLTLEITDVRVQRLEDISENDAKAEGAAFHDGGGIGHSGFRHNENHGFVYATARNSFHALWDSINGEKSWHENPWTWALTFRVHHCNVDAMPQLLAA